MGQPEITEDQRTMVVARLANATRKADHVRLRADDPEHRATKVQGAMAARLAFP